jgi:hypothetical protein
MPRTPPLFWPAALATLALPLALACAPELLAPAPRATTRFVLDPTTCQTNRPVMLDFYGNAESLAHWPPRLPETPLTSTSHAGSGSSRSVSGLPPGQQSRPSSR